MTMTGTFLVLFDRCNVSHSAAFIMRKGRYLNKVSTEIIKTCKIIPF